MLFFIFFVYKNENSLKINLNGKKGDNYGQIRNALQLIPPLADVPYITAPTSSPQKATYHAQWRRGWRNNTILASGRKAGQWSQDSQESQQRFHRNSKA
jgi:hypothetical protein